MRAFAIVLLLTFFVTPAIGAIDYLGTETRWTWEYPDDVPVEEWRVYVSRDGGDPAVEQTVTKKLVTISGAVGETIVVRVQAVMGEHESGIGPPGEAVTLRALPSPGGVAIYCEGGLVEVAPGWWACQ